MKEGNQGEGGAGGRDGCVHIKVRWADQNKCRQRRRTHLLAVVDEDKTARGAYSHARRAHRLGRRGMKTAVREAACAQNPFQHSREGAHHHKGQTGFAADGRARQVLRKPRHDLRADNLAVLFAPGGREKERGVNLCTRERFVSPHGKPAVAYMARASPARPRGCACCCCCCCCLPPGGAAPF